MQPVVRFKAVNVYRGKRLVLRDLNLEFTSGRIIGLLGPSGAGKTTIMRAIVGVQANVKGDVSVLGLPAGDRQLLTRVAYATQQSSVFEDLSLRENLVFAANMLDVPTSRVDEVISRVRLMGHEKQVVGTLSGGERSRASLAMALIGDPEILILDEPTVGLDPVLRAELWDLFHELSKQGKTLLISSHVMDEAERCDDLVFMRDGKLLVHDQLTKVLEATNSKSAEDAFLYLARSANA